jgi:hypothetical protein
MNQKKQTPKQVKTNKPRKRGRPRKNKAVDPPMIKPINAQELIRRELVVKIPLSSKDIEPTTETRRLSILGELESHNLVIRLKEENTLYGLYGIKRKYKVLALYVDNKAEFLDQVNKYIQ